MDTLSPEQLSPYYTFTKREWAKRRADTPLTLSSEEVAALQGLNEPVSIAEVEDIYLPLSRLLTLHVAAAQQLFDETVKFLGTNGHRKVPYIIGLAGSVAVGKSTTGRILQALLSRWPGHPKVDLVPTDGFLLPNAVLERENMMERKGFPGSFDLPALLTFLTKVKGGKRNVEAPVYSHFAYDVMPNKTIKVDQPDILIVEGLNVLQPARLPKDGTAIPFVSDFFEFSIYIDANEEVIERWYIERFMKLRQTAFRDPGSYFHRYSKIDDDEALATATDIWRNINRKNLRENIIPTRQRAKLILRKGTDHAVEKVFLRKL